MVDIYPLESKNDIKQFIQLPYLVYRGQRRVYNAWVPPLNMDIKHIFDRAHNGFYEHAELQVFLARKNGSKNGSVVGRIAAMVDADYCAHQQAGTGFVGFFECIDDAQVAAALFSQAEIWLRKRGMKRVIGPVNGNINGAIGNQIDSFEIPPVIEMPYSPPYYGSFYADAGYRKAADLYSYRMDTRLRLSEKIIRVTKIALKRNNVEIRRTRMKEWDSMVDVVREIWNEAWAENWGYVPWNKEEFRQLAKNLKLVLDPEVTLFAYVDNVPVGFAFPIPNVNDTLRTLNGRLLPFGVFKLLRAKSRAQQLRIAAFGVRKEYHNKGIDAAFIYELYTKGEGKGYNSAEFSWILEENTALRNLLENWGAEHYRTHRMYEKVFSVKRN
ncbi:MAG: GNAT family N-acetyltransferase [Salinispira sp.]